MMVRMAKFRGNFMVHKHQGRRWTVRTTQDRDDAVFDWLTENFGEEDFEHGPWARITQQWSDSPAWYCITDREIIAMMMLKWA